MNEDNLIKLSDNPYHRPIYCRKCGGVLVFTGGGTYKCEDCDAVEYDDWGKVREYLYKYPNANALDIEQAIGIPRKTVNMLLREGKILTTSANAFLRCEICGTPISSGRYCNNCEHKYHENIEKAARVKLHKSENIHGSLSAPQTGDTGRIRYER